MFHELSNCGRRAKGSTDAYQTLLNLFEGLVSVILFRVCDISESGQP
jgi:hypothetical protein